MKLLHHLYKTSTKYKQIGKLHRRMKPILFQVLHGFEFQTVQKRELPNIDISSLISNYSDEYLDTNIAKFQDKIFNYLSKNGIDDYKCFESRFTPLYILQNILQTVTTKEILTFKYKTNEVEFRLYVTEQYQHQDVAIKAIKILTFLEYIQYTDYRIIVNFSPNPATKILPKYKMLGPNSINSGVTIHTYNGVYITIYRDEESDKVLLHELVHNLKLDFAMTPGVNQQINQYIVKDMNITNDIRFVNLFEAYTDSIAIIMNSIMNSILTGKNVHYYFYTELLHIRGVAKLIMDHSGFDNAVDIYNPDCKYRLEQNTSVLSYYILKYGLLSNSDLLLERFFPLDHMEWNYKDMLELYELGKNNIHNIDKGVIHSKSLRMSYNDLLYN